VPTSLRDLFAYRWAMRCTTEASSDVILGHGWAGQGYVATDIDPMARGVGWLLAEGGIPQRVKAAYLSDQDVAALAVHAARLRAPE
jgi:DNA segregation ATPase FtsK/SpoIIIE, S-DNA-T family